MAGRKKLTPAKLLDQRYVEIEELFQRGQLSDIGRCVLNCAAGFEAGIVTFKDVLEEYTS